MRLLTAAFALPLLYVATGVQAQDVPKRSYGKTLPTFTRLDNANDRTYLLPEFCSHFKTNIKDTVWKYEYYDSRDSIVNIDTVSSIGNVRFISLFKSYTDSEHTYKDANGQKKLLPVSSIIQRYDRRGKDKWLFVDYPKNKYMELREFPKEIIHRDTTLIIDPISQKEQYFYYNYYKVTSVR